jgi:hypothetical protein
VILIRVLLLDFRIIVFQQALLVNFRIQILRMVLTRIAIRGEFQEFTIFRIRVILGLLGDGKMRCGDGL